MRSFVYDALIEAGDERDLMVSFPDAPEAITQGDDEADTRAIAEQAWTLPYSPTQRAGDL